MVALIPPFNLLPPDWRTGQTVFNFLEWLAETKGYGTSARMADPFGISDKEFTKLYYEFLKSLNESSKSKTKVVRRQPKISPRRK